MRARMRQRWRSRNGGNRTSTTTENQGSFNVICLAISLGASAHTERCNTEFED
jgi:hypothetical protein